jgi:hypothetical protein
MASTFRAASSPLAVRFPLRGSHFSASAIAMTSDNMSQSARSLLRPSDPLAQMLTTRPLLSPLCLSDGSGDCMAGTYASTVAEAAYREARVCTANELIMGCGQGGW